MINDIKSFEMKNNRISKEGANSLLRNLNHNLLELNLLGNQIGSVGCKHIANFLKSKNIQ